MSESYDVLFSGRIVPGSDEQEVKQLTVKAFHTSPEKLAKLFSGKTVILKSNLSKEAAQTFLKKLKGIGLMCDIKRKVQEESGSKSETEVQPSRVEQPEQQRQTKTKKNTAPETPTKTSDWSVAPAGTDINPLKQPEATSTPDTSQFELRPQQGFLVEPENKPSSLVPNINHLSLEK